MDSISMSPHEALTLRLDVGKMTSGDVFVVECEDGLGELMAFEQRDIEISQPVAVGRYYAYQEPGKRAIVTQLIDAEQDGYWFEVVSSHSKLFEEPKSLAEIENMLDGRLCLLERVDQAAQ